MISIDTTCGRLLTVVTVWHDLAVAVVVGVIISALAYAWYASRRIDAQIETSGTTKIYKLEENGKAKERWVYTRSKPTHTTRVGIGYGGFPRYHRYGYFGGVDYGPRAVYIPEKVAEAIFAGDKLESWERKK